MRTLRRWLGRGREDRSGAAAVEFALVLPLLLLLVLGGLDWGYYFYVAQIVTNSAREGARAGSVELDDTSSTSAATATATAYLNGGGLDTSTATVTATLVGESVRVDVTYPAGSLTGFAEIIVPDNANSTAEMRRF